MCTYNIPFAVVFPLEQKGYGLIHGKCKLAYILLLEALADQFERYVILDLKCQVWIREQTLVIFIPYGPSLIIFTIIIQKYWSPIISSSSLLRLIQKYIHDGLYTTTTTQGTPNRLCCLFTLSIKEKKEQQVYFLIILSLTCTHFLSLSYTHSLNLDEPSNPKLLHHVNSKQSHQCHCRCHGQNKPCDQNSIVRTNRRTTWLSRQPVC